MFIIKLFCFIIFVLFVIIKNRILLLTQLDIIIVEWRDVHETVPVSILLQLAHFAAFRRIQPENWFTQGIRTEYFILVYGSSKINSQ